MRKIILASIILFAARFSVFAQPAATDTRVEYQKGDKAAAVIELPYSPDVVAASIKDNMLKNGLKEEKIKGFQVFRGARLSPTDSSVVDLYFKADRKSRKDDNASVVYLIVGRPNENVALRTGDDAYKVDEAKIFLNNTTPSVDAYNLELTIQQQEATVKKAEKHLTDLQNDQRDYEKKISSMNEKLGQVKRDIDIQTADVAKQKAARDAMVARRSAPVLNQ